MFGSLLNNIMKTVKLSLLLLLPIILASSIFAQINLVDVKMITNKLQDVYYCLFTDPSVAQAQKYGVCVTPGLASTTVEVIQNTPGTVDASYIIPASGSPFNMIGYFSTSGRVEYAALGVTIPGVINPGVNGILPSYKQYFSIVVPPNKEVYIKYLAIDKHVSPPPIVLEGKDYSKEEIYNEPPSVQILSPSDGSRVEDVFQLQFKATDPEGRAMTCTYKIDNGSPRAIGSVVSGDTVNVQIELYYIGEHTVTVECTDPYEASGSASITVINKKIPTVVVADPKENSLIETTSYTLTYYVGDNVPVDLDCEIKVDDTTIDTFTEHVESTLKSGTRTLDLSSLSAGSHTITLTCTDQYGLQNSDTVDIDFATDEDDLQRACEYHGHEWYTDHCCGDDPGEYMSTQAQPGQAFDYTSCTLIDLNPGECDDVGDCIHWSGSGTGWFCSSSTQREHRVYNCNVQPGNIVGSCEYSVDQTEDCTNYGADYFCSDGVCTNTEYTNQPPTVTITQPEDGSTVSAAITQKYLDIHYTVTDDTSDYASCVLSYDGNNINLGAIKADGSEQIAQIKLNPSKTDYSVTIDCTDKDNAIGSAAVSFTINYTVYQACEVDSDCGVDGWVCTSSTHRAYYDYSCNNGVCQVQVTSEEDCASGTFCLNGQCVNQIPCNTDADCPHDEYRCDGNNVVYRDFYCDTNTGYCTYTDTQVKTCESGTVCQAGVCVTPGTCAPPTYVCLDQSTRAEVVFVYDENIGKCVGYLTATENCASGESCTYGVCSSGTYTNLAPSLEWISPSPSTTVNVGQPVTFKFKVSDDNSLAILVRVFVAHSPEKKIYESVVASGNEVSVTYTPEESGTYTVRAEAIDGYGTQTVYTTTIEATGGAGGGGAAPPAAGAGGAGGGGAPIPVAPTGPAISPLLVLGIIGGVVIIGALAYFIMRK